MENLPRIIVSHPLMANQEFVILDKNISYKEGKIDRIDFPIEFNLDTEKSLTHDQLLFLNVGINLICEFETNKGYKKVSCYKYSNFVVMSEDESFGNVIDNKWNIKKSEDFLNIYYDHKERKVKWYLDKKQENVIKLDAEHMNIDNVYEAIQLGKLSKESFKGLFRR